MEGRGTLLSEWAVLGGITEVVAEGMPCLHGELDDL